MFRRRTSSTGKIHYRVNINKNMCLGVVDIYIDGKPYQHGFNGSYLDIYRDKKIKTISISGQISYLNPKNEYNVILGISGGIIEGTLTYQYNSGMHCELANKVTYGVSWDGDYVLNNNCIVTDLCSGCESYAYGKSSRGDYRVTVRIV